MTDIPDHAYCTPESIPRCGCCGFSFGDHTKPEGMREWCRMLLNTTTCRVIPDHHAINLRSDDLEGELRPWGELS